MNITVQDYAVHIDYGVLKDLAGFITEDLKSHIMVVITDNQVKKYYANAVIKTLSKQGYKTDLISFPNLVR